MKINRSLMEILILVGLFIWIGSASAVQGASSGPVAANTAKVMEAEAGYLENITFEKLKGKERVVVMLSRQSGASAEDQGSMTVTVKLENLYVPQNLRRAMGEGSLDNLIRVVPVQRTTGGRPQALISMELSKRVPYSVRQEGHYVIVDFNVATLPATTISGDKPAPPEQVQVKAAVSAQKPPVQPNAVSPPYAGRLVSLDFQEASIKSVLQLLAEEGRVSIVSGDDVKGNVTVSLKKIPWEQALYTILAISDMTSIQEGDIIRVMKNETLRKANKDAAEAEKVQRTAEEARKKEALDKMVEEGKQRQISIEAKIVEASDEFFRGLGVQWGGNYTGNLRAAKGVYPYGVGIGTGTDVTNRLPIGGGLGLTETGAAVNLPGILAQPTIGLVIGSANAVISAQLSALETNNLGKVISTPKVTTMDGVKAKIEQGDEIPYVTKDAQGSPTVNWKKATLSLEVTPKITREGKISMDVKATNDTPQYDKAAQLQGNVPISTSQVTSTVVIQDGDTLVIGGILKTQETKGTSGVPWISKVPILGWLFKTEDITKMRKQLLVFITPRIVNKEVTSSSL